MIVSQTITEADCRTIFKLASTICKLLNWLRLVKLTCIEQNMSVNNSKTLAPIKINYNVSASPANCFTSNTTGAS
jgi:hypothetical protein